MRLKSDAEGGLREPNGDAANADNAARRRYRLALDTCEGLLVMLDRSSDRH
jgi:hypothetical protein